MLLVTNGEAVAGGVVRVPGRGVRAVGRHLGGQSCSPVRSAWPRCCAATRPQARGSTGPPRARARSTLPCSRPGRRAHRRLRRPAARCTGRRRAPTVRGPWPGRPAWSVRTRSLGASAGRLGVGHDVGARGVVIRCLGSVRDRGGRHGAHAAAPAPAATDAPPPAGAQPGAGRPPRGAHRPAVARDAAGRGGAPAARGGLQRPAMPRRRRAGRRRGAPPRECVQPARRGRDPRRGGVRGRTPGGGPVRGGG